MIESSATSEPTAHVGADGYAHALAAGQGLVDVLKKDGKSGLCIELMGSQVDINAINFSKGWNDATKDSGVAKTIQQVPTEWNPELFLSGTTNAFKAHPEANCLFVASDFALSAVQSALESVGRWKPEGDPEHVYMASVGLMPTAIKAMEGRYLDVSALWDSFTQASELDRVIIAIAKGEDPGCGDKGCLVSGRVASPDTVKSMPSVWSRDYTDQ